MFQSASIELTQKPQLSQNLQQSLKVLSMNTIELEQYVQSQFEENIFLEEAKAEENEETLRCLEYIHQYNKSSALSYTKMDLNEDDYESDIPSKDDKTLKSYIINQLDIIHMTHRQLGIIKVLVEFLDDNGYFDCSVEQVVAITGLSEVDIKNGIEIIQQLDPPGLGARDLSECLKIQLDRLGIKENYIFVIVEKHLELLGKGHLNAISESMGIPISLVRKSLDIIRRLNPKPARGFYRDAPGYILPDIVILGNKNGTFEPYVNDSSTQNFYVNTLYHSMCKSGQDAGIMEYYKNQLSGARWLIKCIVQRKLTLLKITEAIIEIQQQFLINGHGHLVPMTLMDIANLTGFHISTVSRAISEKHILCPRGLFNMKQLFNRVVGTQVNHLNESVKNPQNIRMELVRLVQTENRQHPYTDDKLCSLLAEEGFSIMRRTVAKYREELGIPCKSLRKSCIA